MTSAQVKWSTSCPHRVESERTVSEVGTAETEGLVGSGNARRNNRDGDPAAAVTSVGSSDGLTFRCVSGTEAVIAGIRHAYATGGVATGFQSIPWLKALYSVVASMRGGEPRLVTLTDETGRLVVAVPLIIRRERGLKVAECADLGLADYCVPLMGPGVPASPAGSAGTAPVYRAILAALGDVDLVRFEKMPRDVAGRINPLALHPSAFASRFNRNSLTIDSTVDAFIASCGKKNRKEAARAWRRLEEMGDVRLARAQTDAQIDIAYCHLEAWQSERHRRAGRDYVLDQPEISRFYHTLLKQTVASGEASLFILSVQQPGGGAVSRTAARELVAVLLGTKCGDTFTVLRIADAGGKWRHTSPGRMIVLKTMRRLVDEGVRTFDLGIGDYRFKRWLGARPSPLVDVTLARTWRALPAVYASIARRRLREIPSVRAIVRKIRALGNLRG